MARKTWMSWTAAVCLAVTHAATIADDGRLGPIAPTEIAPTEAPTPDATKQPEPTATQPPAAATDVVDDAQKPLVDPAPRPVAANERLPLGVPAIGPQAATGPVGSEAKSGFTNHWLIRTVLALGAVIGLIFAFRFVVTFLAGRSGGLAHRLGPGGKAPSGVLEVLGRYPISRGQTLALLKLDRRVLLVSQTAGGMQTLTEITDADEVASILLRVRDDEGESMAARFSSMLRTLEKDPSVADVESPAASPRLVRDAYTPSSTPTPLHEGARRIQELRELRG